MSLSEGGNFNQKVFYSNILYPQRTRAQKRNYRSDALKLSKSNLKSQNTITICFITRNDAISDQTKRIAA